MMHDLKEEISSIEKVDCINDKLLILAVYNEFYNSALAALDKSQVDYYKEFMTLTFDLVCKTFALNKDKEFDVNDFMSTFIGLLKINNVTRFTDVYELVDMFEEQLQMIIESSTYVEIIDKYDLEFKLKALLMIKYRFYLNTVYTNFVLMYGEDNCADIGAGLLDDLDKSFDEFLANSVAEEIPDVQMLMKIEPSMKEAAKEYLFDIVRNNYQALNNFPKPDADYAFNHLDEKSQKAILMMNIYATTNYEIGINTMEEIAKELGVSEDEATVILSNALINTSLYAIQYNSEHINDDDSSRGNK